MVNVAYDTPWVELRRYEQGITAHEHALVLAAMGLNYRLVRRPEGIGLDVVSNEALRADYELAAYDEENRPQPERKTGEIVSSGIAAAGFGGAIAFLLLIATKGQWLGVDWIDLGSAQSGLILKGEWWRSFTALGLHADFAHLIGNLILGSLFAMMLSERLGAGVAWFAIVLAGAGGNALNAWVQDAGHVSVGSSTAVFAALGLLAALSWSGGRAHGTRGFRRWLPLAGGVLLLAFLGVGDERTDLYAHIFGFGCGAVLGVPLSLMSQASARRPKLQLGTGFASFVVFALAWFAALS